MHDAAFVAALRPARAPVVIRAMLALVFVLASASPALAESFFPSDMALSCSYGSPEIDPRAGSIPANWPAFVIALFGVDGRMTRMTRVSDGHDVPLRFDLLSGVIQFVPMEPLVVGESYLVEHPPCLSMPVHTTLYDVVAPIVAPTTVGTVEVLGPYASNVQPGRCHRHTFVDVVFTPDPAYASAPWSAYEWGAGIDGADVQFGQPLTTMHQRIAIDCGLAESWLAPVIAEGHHDFVVRTWQRYAGDLTAQQSASVAVSVSCADALRVDDATLRPLDQVERARWDTDTDSSCAPDGGVEMDAALPMDASVRDAAVDGAAHTEPDTRPNCACGVSRGRWSAWPFVALAVVALARTRRRHAAIEP